MTTLTIPIFVRSGTDEVRRQQRTRMAAYRQLIRVNENADSLFEILLDRARSQGTAMKPSSQDFEVVKRALRRIPCVIRVG